MPQSFLRGLRLLETVDFYGPLTVSELGRRLGVDKATASRMVAACEVEGWIVRTPDGIVIGPRAALLGQSASAGDVLRLAEPLVHAICGVTGIFTQAVSLIGEHGIAIATASVGNVTVPPGLSTKFPIWLSAGSKCLASQLAPEALAQLLPDDPFPAPWEIADDIAPAAVIGEFRLAMGLPTAVPTSLPTGATLVSTRAVLEAQLADIRGSGVFADRGEVMPEVSCVSVPWPQPGLPSALTCTGGLDEVAAARPMIERVLRAAARPGATRESIVTAAAA